MIAVNVMSYIDWRAANEHIIRNRFDCRLQLLSTASKLSYAHLHLHEKSRQSNHGT